MWPCYACVIRCETNKPGSGRHLLHCSLNGEFTRGDYSEEHRLQNGSVGSRLPEPEHYLLFGFFVMAAMIRDCSSVHQQQSSVEKQARINGHLELS